MEGEGKRETGATMAAKADDQPAGLSRKKAPRYFVGTIFIWLARSHTKIKDMVNGPYKTINEAIAAAEPGGIILVNQGKYAESLIIT